jgi:hypothetical protein
VARLFETHGRLDPPRTDACLAYLGSEPDEVRAFGPIVQMRGHFTLGMLNSRTHDFIFTPSGVGRGRAIVMPVYQNAEMVDLLAVSRRDATVWGTVTGRGLFIGNIEANAPMYVYRNAWRWLVWGCRGVLPLDKAACVKLQSASQLITESVAHAFDLADQVWINPALYEGVGTIDAAEEQAATRILVDGSNEEIEREIRAWHR